MQVSIATVLPHSLAPRATSLSHRVLLFSLLRCQDLINLLPGGPTYLTRLCTCRSLWERRVGAKIFELLVPVLEDRPDFCFLLVRKA